MFRYTKIGLNSMAFFIALLFFFVTEIGEVKMKPQIQEIQDKIQFFYQISFHSPVKISMKDSKEESKTQSKYSWGIKIPSINLEAPILEGTSSKNLDEGVGHFTETSNWDGNVGLAAHNRGYRQNFFARLKEMKKGDEIYYTKDGKTRKYRVNTITIVQDTDWSYLQNTKENIITLITCVEDKPEERRVIQGIENKEENNETN